MAQSLGVVSKKAIYMKKTKERRQDNETRKWVNEIEKFLKPKRKWVENGKIKYSLW